MPSSVIKATRSTITNRLPVCGFAIRTGRNPWYEVALATDPQLFAPDAKDRRRPGNFFSTRAAGPLPAERGEAVYLVSPEVLARFAGQPRLYYTLATFRDRSRSVAEVPPIQPDAIPFVSLSQSFTGQSLRRLIGVPIAGAGLAGNGGSYGSTSPEAMTWAGDTARPGSEPVAPGGNGSSGSRPPSPGGGTPSPAAPATPPATSSQGLDYDDGFGRAFWSAPRPAPLPADIPIGPDTFAATRPFAGSVDIDWDEVVLTPDTGQPNAYAAAAAMVVGWRDRVCIAPDTILQAVTQAGGDPTDREAYATAWDLVHVRGAAYETVELKGMIESHGPLWAANGDRSAANAGHAFVITGVCGDGTATGTNVYIDDPWGQVTGSPAAAASNPAPGGPGTRFSISFQDLAAQFPTRPGVPPTHAWLELLHARDVTGRVPGRIGCAATSTQSLEARIRPLDLSDRAGRPLSRGVPFATETDAEGNEDHGIDGPIPDEAPAAVAASLARARALTAAEYPLASRFVAARWFRVPATPRTISRVVVHITDGGSNINGTIGWFQNPVNADGTPRKVSAHYVVGRDGEVVQMVEHANVAWHASSANGDSIGIEHCANTRGLNPTPAQYSGSASLVRWLCDTYGIPVDREHVLGHSEADPRTTHTGCPNAVWDWSTFMNLVQSASNTVSPAPASQGFGGPLPGPFSRPASAPVRPRPLVYRPLRAAPLGMVSVHWDEVQLVAQTTGDNCWAAAASMVVGWRDRMSIDPALLPRPADIPALARAFDLEIEPAQSYTVDGFADLLTRKGPLWVAALVPGFHAIVVTGIQGDGDPDTTLVYVSDPWERDPGSPGAPGPYRASPGSGSRYTLTYRNFVDEYEAVPQDPSYRHITVQILHARDTGGRAPGVVPTTQSLGLRSRAAAAFRFSRELAVSAFMGEAMERMRATFLANKAAAHRLNCIEIMNAGLRSLFDARLRDASGGNLALGSSVQATMGRLQEYGLADAPTDFEYFDAAGRPTRGVNRPETLRQSVEAWIYQQCEVNQQSAYYAFGLSVMDGYHSVLLPVAFSGTGDPSTKVYWADQIYSGWDDVTGGLDARITERTQRWWDGATPKPRTRCRVWPLLG